MYLVLLVIHIIVTLSLIGIILVQRSAADGLGGLGGGGGGGGVMTSRAQANLLTRTTAILAAVFILNSLALSWLTQQDVRDRSLADKLIEQQAAPIAVPLPSEANISAPAMADKIAPTKTPEVPKPE